MGLVSKHKVGLSRSRREARGLLYQRAKPGTENVARRVRVSVMDRTAIAAAPFSYHQTFSTFRAANHTAIGTSLSGESFIDLNILSAARNRFVAEHLSEARPARIVYGLGHLGFREARRVHVAYSDEIKFADQPRAEFVEKVFAARCDLRMNAPSGFGLTRSLRRRQPRFTGPIELRCLNSFACAECRQSLKAKVYADATLGFTDSRVRNAQNNIQVPAATRILRERTAVTNFGSLWNGAAIPNGVNLPVEAEGITDPVKIISLEGNPSEGTLSSVSNGPLANRPARSNILFAHTTDRVARNTKFSVRTSREFHQRVCARPKRAPAHGMLLSVSTIVPNEIDRPRHAVQSASVLVFNSIAQRQMHCAEYRSAASEWKGKRHA